MGGQGSGRTSEVTARELVEFVAELVALRKRKGEIKRAIYHVCGKKISRGSVETLLRRARALIAQRSLMSIDEHRANALALYEKIIADDGSSERDKMTAQAGINEIIGLSAKFGVQPGGAADLSDRAALMRQRLSEMDESIETSDETRTMKPSPNGRLDHHADAAAEHET